MSRKHFRAIATAIYKTDVTDRSRLAMATAIANSIAWEDSFNKHRFIRWCMTGSDKK